MEIEKLVETLTPEQQLALLENVKEYENAITREQGQNDFLSFVHTMWPVFVDGRHHGVMAKNLRR